MHCFFASLPEKAPGRWRLEGREAHHAVRVLRVRPGEVVLLLDGQGRQWRCEVLQADAHGLDLRVLESQTQPAPTCSLHLFQAVLKARAFDAVLQHATELGAHRIVPVLSEHVVPHWGESEVGSKLEKWQRITVEALKQCRSAWLPRLEPPAHLATVLARGERFDLMLVASLRANATIHARFEEACHRLGRAPQSVALWIGPEGDFTDAELDELIQAGVQPVSLGSHVLRAETAALCCLACVSHELRWRGALK